MTQQLQLPPGWKYEKLGNISYKIMKGIFNLSPINYVEEGIPFLRISDIDKNRVNLSHAKRISCESNNQFPNSQMVPGDIVLAKVGSAGDVSKVAKISDDIPICNISQNLVGIKVDRDKVVPDYLVYVLRLQRNMNLILSKSNITTLKAIRLDVLRDFLIPLPTIKIQHAIVRRIDSLLERFEQQKNTILLLNQKKIEKIGYIIANLRIDTIQKYIPLNNYPSNWRITKLSEITEVGQGGTPSTSESRYWNGRIPWLRSGELLNNRILDSKQKITEEGLRKSSTHLCPKGTILLAMTGQGLTRGRTALLDIAACSNQSCAYIINKNTQVTTEYLWLFLQSRYWVIRSVHHGSGQPGINTTTVKNFDILVPTIVEQDLIVKKVNRNLPHVEAIKSDLKRIVEADNLELKLQSLSTSIIESVLSGKIIPEA